MPITWAEVGSGSQRATQSPGSVASTTKAFPGNVTSGSLLAILGSSWRSFGGVVPMLVEDTLGTVYTVVHTGGLTAFSGDQYNWIAYGIAPSSGACTVTVEVAR